MGKIYTVTFSSHYYMNATLMRAAQFKESPRFGGKVESLEKCMDLYYLERQNPEFSYFDDWSGYNLSRKDLDEFVKNYWLILGDKERKFFEHIAEVPSDGYVIAVLPGDPDGALNHEIVHGVYGTNEEYRTNVDIYLQSQDVSDICHTLRAMGYRDLVHADELNAYATTGLSSELKKHKKQFDKLIPRLQRMLKDATGCDLKTKAGIKRLRALPDHLGLVM